MKLYSKETDKIFSKINIFLSDEELQRLHKMLENGFTDTNKIEFIGLDKNNLPTKKIILRISDESNI